MMVAHTCDGSMVIHASTQEVERSRTNRSKIERLERRDAHTNAMMISCMESRERGLQVESRANRRRSPDGSTLMMVDPAEVTFLRRSPHAIGLILIKLQGRLRKSHILRSLAVLLLFCGLSHSFAECSVLRGTSWHRCRAFEFVTHACRQQEFSVLIDVVELDRAARVTV